MKKVVKEVYRIEYTRYFKNQRDSATAYSLEEAKEKVEYYNTWERNARIVKHWVVYEGNEWVEVKDI